MASADERSSKIAPESQTSRVNHSANFFAIDLTLRVILFASCLAGIIDMVTSKQTELIPVPSLRIVISNTAKFNHSPAFIYYVVALSVAGFYSLVSILSSLVSKPRLSTKLLFHFILLDLLMLGIVASATGSAGSIAYTGLKGNSHAGWPKICDTYGKFCRHIGSSVAVSLIASILLVVLIMLSTYTLYRRSS